MNDSIYPYVYAWHPQFPGCLSRKGQPCRVLVRGGRNSALVEFEDGARISVAQCVARRGK
jgi:hypothetical protein